MRKDHILEEDINRLAGQLDKEALKDAVILVTGATGLIGSQIVKALKTAESAGVKVLAMVRNRGKADKMFADYGPVEYLVQDVCDEITYEGRVDYIIHCASMTGSKDFVDHPVDVIRTGLHGTENILEFARKADVKSMVYLSSMEVYGNPDENAGKITENSYAYFDHLKPRSSYPESKKMIECLCVAYASQYGVPVKIARLTQTFGAGVNYQDGRVFAEFARCVIEDKNIVLHTKGETVRNYCYVSDAIRALFVILLQGNNAEAYNVANEKTTCSIAEMAELAAGLSENGIRVEYDLAEDISAFGYAPKLIMDLDTSKIRSLGWEPQYDLQEMFQRTIASMHTQRQT